MGCFWVSRPKPRPQPKKPADNWPQINGGNGANGRIVSHASTSSDDSDQDKVPALLSSGLSSFPEHCRRFKYRELEEATSGFDDELAIGEGGFGKVYRATLGDGMQVAIKRLDRRGMQGDKEFGMEASMLCSLRHPNIVTLRGVCVEGDNRCTIFDLAANGSLRTQLDMKKEGLNWAQRANVALGAARGLAYLHDEAEPPVVHRDFKTSNILVDAKWNGVVADFGLARRMKSRGGAVHEPLPPECTVVMGTFGYVAPEYARTGTLNEKSDVYAFGVVLLELLTGAEVVDPQRPLANRNLVDWLYSKLHDIAQVKEVLDPCLGEVSDGELAAFCELAGACLQHDGWRRPRMTEAAALLAQICALHAGEVAPDAGHRPPPTPRQAPPPPRPASRVTPTSSGEGQHSNGTGLASAMAGAPAGGPAAFRSLSHETTIVCLDGGGTDSPGADQVRDPFAASVGKFQPPGTLPEQRGYSGHAGGVTPFAGLSSVAAGPLPPMQQAPQQLQQQRPPPRQQASPPQQQAGQGLRVATKPPPGPSRMAAAGGSGGGHNRAGSFSESLDILAAKLGLSGPIGPNGQPVFAGAPQSGQQPPPPRPQRDWTFNNMAWNLPAQPGQPRAAMLPQQPTLQQQRRPQDDPASVQYIQRLKAHEGAAFVSSTQEWKRRSLSPAAGHPGAGPLPAGARAHPAAAAAPYGSSPPQAASPPYAGRAMPPIAAGYGYPSAGAAAYGQQPARYAPGMRPPQSPTAALSPRRPQSPRVSNGWAPRQQSLQQSTNPPWMQSRRDPRDATQQREAAAMQQQQQQQVLQQQYAQQQAAVAAQQQQYAQQQAAAAAAAQPAPPPPDPFAASQGLPPASVPQQQQSSTPFHSAEPCMVCKKEMREWHLAPCGHAVGCKPCVIRLARVGEPCPVCSTPATGMLHARFVRASPAT